MTSQTVINRRLDNRDGLFGSANSLATFPGVHPYASHFRFDLAAAVLPDATTGTIAQRLGAIHRAGHAGFTQCALTAGLRVKEKPLNHAFDCGKGLVQPIITNPSKNGFQ